MAAGAFHLAIAIVCVVFFRRARCFLLWVSPDVSTERKAAWLIVGYVLIAGSLGIGVIVWGLRQ
jgi:hypothetical protein